MARQTVPIAIEGERYELTQLGSLDALSVFHRLTKVLGPLARGVLSDHAAKKSGEAQEEARALRLIERFIAGYEAMPLELTLDLAQLFARHTKVLTGGLMVELAAGDILDQHFAGRVSHLNRWLIEHLKLNYPDFLAKLAAFAAAAEAEAGK